MTLVHAHHPTASSPQANESEPNAKSLRQSLHIIETRKLHLLEPHQSSRSCPRPVQISSRVFCGFACASASSSADAIHPPSDEKTSDTATRPKRNRQISVLEFTTTTEASSSPSSEVVPTRPGGSIRSARKSPVRFSASLCKRRGMSEFLLIQYR